MRSAVKAAVEHGMTLTGATRLLRQRMKGRALVLAYHNIVPDGTSVGDRPNHLSVSAFAAQLDALQATHDVIPLTATLDLPPTRGRPCAAITFDDAYRGAVTLGVEELARRGMPATIFVAPAFLDGKSFWWDALATPAGLDPGIRSRALTDLAGRDESVRDWASREGVPIASVPQFACAASDAELAQLARRPGISLASHSWSHPNLTRLTPNELAAELTRPRAWLRERFDNAIDWLAYPYGIHDRSVIDAARRAGYRAAMAIDGGWIPRSTPDPFALPRLNVAPGLSIHGFAIRTAGLLCR